MALPQLTWSMGDVFEIEDAQNASILLKAIYDVYDSDAYWGVSDTDTGTSSPTKWVEIKPRSGSAIPDCRVLFAVGESYHTDNLMPSLYTYATSGGDIMLHVAMAPDAGTTGPDDDDLTSSGPAYSSRWTKLGSFMRYDNALQDRVFAISSDEITALWFFQEGSDTNWRLAMAGAMLEAHPDDAEADERIWGLQRSGYSTVWNGNWLLRVGTNDESMFHSQFGNSSGQFCYFDPSSPSTVQFGNCTPFMGGGGDFVLGEFTSKSGKIRPRPWVVYETTGDTLLGQSRQMYMWEWEKCRTRVLKDSDGSTLGYIWSPYLRERIESMIFSNEVLA